MAFIEKHMNRMDPGEVKVNEMLDQRSFRRHVGPVARIAVFHHPPVILCDGLGDAMLSSWRQALRILTPSPRDQGSTQPFGNGLMGFSAFESTDNLGTLAIVFERHDDLFYPAVLLAQVILFFFQVFVLPL